MWMFPFTGYAPELCCVTQYDVRYFDCITYEIRAPKLIKQINA